MIVGLDGQAIVVTGAASGIGRAIALQAASSSVQALLLTDVNVEGLNSTADKMSSNVRVEIAVDDLSDVSAACRIAKAAREKLGRIDGLVNAAGITTRGGVVDGSAADWDDLFAINARAPFFLMQQAILDMKSRSAPGSIVNILSINAHCGHPELAIYAATKGALQTLTRNAANAHLSDRIRVNGINLGWTMTEAEHEMQSRTLDKGDDWAEQAAKTLPLGQLILPNEVARLAVYLLSPSSAPLTGAALDLEQRVTGAPG